jgi:hypothetical protein
MAASEQSTGITLLSPFRSCLQLFLPGGAGLSIDRPCGECTLPLLTVGMPIRVALRASLARYAG